MKDFKYKKNKGASVEATITSKQRGHGESVIEFPAGILTLDWYYIPLLDEAGAVDSLLVVYNDITDRRRAGTGNPEPHGGFQEKSQGNLR